MAKRGQELTEKRSSNVQSRSYPEDRMKSDTNHQKGHGVCESPKKKLDRGGGEFVVVVVFDHYRAKNSSTSCSKAGTREQNPEVTLVCRPW